MLGRLSFTITLVLAPLAAVAQEDPEAFFEKNVRPVLVRQCLGCHSASSQPVMGGLRLDDREAALKGGSRGAAIVAGAPAESLLVKVLRHEAGPLKMPPGPKMKDADVALIAKWIEMGAPWGKSSVAVAKPAEKFWAFVPPRMPEIPAGGRTPIDGFLQRELTAKGLKAAGPADKRTLIRRVTFDLTGLPPTAAEVSAFLADSSPDAFARVVDRLLASPRYGERWARHWLDVARYADSNGLDENLVYKNAFRYRDYVIAAFNQDKPYDLFLKEQLAGDLLPESQDLPVMFERWTATGFLSLGAKMLAEDDPVKMQMDIVDEQLDTTMKAFTGLTVGCARCHDHKFDPIPQADYYALAGIFKSSKTMEDFKVVARWHEYVLAPKADRDRLSAHQARIDAKAKEIQEINKAQNRQITDQVRQRVGDYLLAATALLANNEKRIAPLEKEADGIVLAAGAFASGNVPRTLVKGQPNKPKDSKGPYFAEYTIEIPAAGAYQIDILDEEKGSGTADLWVNGHWVRRGLPPVANRAASPEVWGWTALGVFDMRAGANRIRLEHRDRFPHFTKLLVARSTVPDPPLTAEQTAAAAGLNPSVLNQLVEHLERSRGAASSVLFGWEIATSGADRASWSSPVAGRFAGLAEPRQWAARYTEVAQLALAEGAAADAGLKAMHELLTEKFGPFRAPGDARRYYPAEIQAMLGRLDEERKTLESATPDLPRAMGVKESGQAADVPLHVRGSHWTLGEKVPRGFIRALGGTAPSGLGEAASGRLQLAEWLARPDHPLTARVMMNRVWRWHFGKGIVPTVDNFGRLGEKPTNQPLLDYLALRFVENGWSVKKMHREMLLTDAYQRSSTLDAQAAEIDPENTLLWRYPRRRLEAEPMRDAIMMVSGDLDLKTAGGSLLNYKDRQYVSNTAKRGEVDYERNIRAVYIPVVRSSLYDVFSAFDLPDPATPNGDRDSSVVAPQALFMMNGAVMLRHSLAMARNLLGNPDWDDAARVREAYSRALARPAAAAEVDQALTFIAQMQTAWRGDRERAWQSFCKALLSSKEFLYLN
jgi:cytochrome c553